MSFTSICGCAYKFTMPRKTISSAKITKGEEASTTGKGASAKAAAHTEQNKSRHEFACSEEKLQLVIARALYIYSACFFFFVSLKVRIQLKGKLYGKVNFTNMLAFWWVSDLVKVFPVISLPSARNWRRRIKNRKSPGDIMGSQCCLPSQNLTIVDIFKPKQIHVNPNINFKISVREFDLSQPNFPGIFRCKWDLLA